MQQQLEAWASGFARVNPKVSVPVHAAVPSHLGGDVRLKVRLPVRQGRELNLAIALRAEGEHQSSPEGEARALDVGHDYR